MGQYRLSIYGKWQLGLLVKLDKYSISISLPIVKIIVATTKEARGFYLFGLEL